MNKPSVLIDLDLSKVRPLWLADGPVVIPMNGRTVIYVVQETGEYGNDAELVSVLLTSEDVEIKAVLG